MKGMVIGKDGMTLEDLVAIAREGVRLELAKESEESIVEARKLIERWVREEKSIYGVTTGFGAQSDVIISREDNRQLQKTPRIITS